jgi:flagellar basal-body rod protein FlgF
MAAAAARAEQLDSIADNLANVETPGFKASHPAFQSFLPRPGGARGPSDKVSTAVVGSGANLATGTIVGTGNPLDVVPKDDGFLVIDTGSGPGFTRNGRLMLNGDGFLVSAGHPLVGVSGNLIQVPPGAPVTLRESGAVMSGQVELDRLSMVRLTGPVGHLGASLYAPVAGQGGAAVPMEPGMTVGQVELGNSTALQATVDMIGAQRQFETAMQAIQTYRRLDDRVIEVGKSR